MIVSKELKVKLFKKIAKRYNSSTDIDSAITVNEYREDKNKTEILREALYLYQAVIDWPITSEDGRKILDIFGLIASYGYNMNELLIDIYNMLGVQKENNNV